MKDQGQVAFSVGADIHSGAGIAGGRSAVRCMVRVVIHLAGRIVLQAGRVEFLRLITVRLLVNVKGVLVLAVCARRTLHWRATPVLAALAVLALLPVMKGATVGLCWATNLVRPRSVT